MYSRVCRSLFVFAVGIAFDIGHPFPVFAQASFQASASGRQQPGSTTPPRPPPLEVPMAREASGTSWLPDDTPMYAIHRQRGPWQLMFHENAFLQFLDEASGRVSNQAGSINWIMGMAQRNAGSGWLRFRAMFSAEPWTIGGCGYPDLLASGEQCKNENLHDRQHPHDLFMELATVYDRPVNDRLRWQLYGGPVGEPALGPVAYPHRISAMPNPLAPIAHHWLDSTHVSFGVVTTGIYGYKWKAEGSIFNGREPDEKRTDFDFGALDSFSGRFWLLPTASVALQVSAARLKEAEAAEGLEPRQDIKRITASATYHRIGEQSVWASTLAWGRNSELGRASNAALIESSLTLSDRHAWFGRLEVAGKTPHDLDLPDASENLLTLSKIQGGYTRYFRALRGFRPGLGAESSIGFVPPELRSAYGSRANIGGGIFVTVRPSAMPAMRPAGQPVSGGGMIMVQTALDPAKLECSPPIDPTTAPSTVYEGMTFFFCSEKDRAEFLLDPEMSLSMMPPRR